MRAAKRRRLREATGATHNLKRGYASSPKAVTRDFLPLKNAGRPAGRVDKASAYRNRNRLRRCLAADKLQLVQIRRKTEQPCSQMREQAADCTIIRGRRRSPFVVIRMTPIGLVEGTRYIAAVVVSDI